MGDEEFPVTKLKDRCGDGACGVEEFEDTIEEEASEIMEERFRFA